jgi:hypothetical protein
METGSRSVQRPETLGRCLRRDVMVRGASRPSTMFPSRESETRVALMADVCELDRRFLSGGVNALPRSLFEFDEPGHRAPASVT